MRLALAILVLLLAIPGLQAQEAVKQCADRHPVGVARADCKKAPSLCAPVRGELQPRCAHAVGGAAMFATGHDEAASRAICAGLPDAQRRECDRGVQYELDVLKHEGVHAHQH